MSLQAAAKTVVRAEVWRERMGSVAVKKEDMNKYGCGRVSAERVYSMSYLDNWRGGVPPRCCSVCLCENAFADADMSVWCVGCCCVSRVR